MPSPFFYALLGLWCMCAENQAHLRRKQVDFEKLRTDTITVASLLIEKGYDAQVSETLTNIFKGVRLSELAENQDNIDKLQVALSTLEDLKERARL